MAEGRIHDTASGVGLALALGIVLSACIGSGDCDFEPIGASLRPPPLAPIAGDALGQCGRWVEIDGSYWTESTYDFTLARADLEEHGTADAVAEPFVTPLAGATTYAIAGVDPTEIVAMEAAAGGFVVFAQASDDFPPELCPYLAPEGNPDRGPCPGPEPDR